MNKELSANYSEEGNYYYRIYYEDTDAGGLVYYANYLKFFERARTDLLREKSIYQSELKERLGIIFIVRKCQIEYFASARLDDLVMIKTSVIGISGASINFKQEMLRSKDQKLLSILDVELACINSSSMKPTRIPQEIKSSFLPCKKY